jgi:hypothetical protein
VPDTMSIFKRVKKLREQRDSLRQDKDLPTREMFAQMEVSQLRTEIKILGEEPEY